MLDGESDTMAEYGMDYLGWVLMHKSWDTHTVLL